VLVLRMVMVPPYQLPAYGYVSCGDTMTRLSETWASRSRRLRYGVGVMLQCVVYDEEQHQYKMRAGCRLCVSVQR